MQLSYNIISHTKLPYKSQLSAKLLKEKSTQHTHTHTLGCVNSLRHNVYIMLTQTHVYIRTIHQYVMTCNLTSVQFANSWPQLLATRTRRTATPKSLFKKRLSSTPSSLCSCRVCGRLRKRHSCDGGTREDGSVSSEIRTAWQRRPPVRGKCST